MYGRREINQEIAVSVRRKKYTYLVCTAFKKVCSHKGNGTRVMNRLHSTEQKCEVR